MTETPTRVRRSLPIFQPIPKARKARTTRMAKKSMISNKESYGTLAVL